MSVKKHPMVIAWEKWLDSLDGSDCTSPDILHRVEEQQFLENRLNSAFMSGWRAAEKRLNGDE
jgi:hypothetical protein